MVNDNASFTGEGRTGQLYILEGKTVKAVPATVFGDNFAGNLNNRILNSEVIGDAQLVTCFLGYDHSVPMAAGASALLQTVTKGSPILFETVITGGGELDGTVQRYATYDQAMAGHDVWLRKLRAIAQ